jgi:hypothetical protein
LHPQQPLLALGDPADERELFAPLHMLLRSTRSGSQVQLCGAIDLGL